MKQFNTLLEAQLKGDFSIILRQDIDNKEYVVHDRMSNAFYTGEYFTDYDRAYNCYLKRIHKQIEYNLVATK